LKVTTVESGRPGFAFFLPWSFDLEGGGVAHAVFGLADQCRTDSTYSPIALEMDWQCKRPVLDQWRGIPRVRLRLRTPWQKEYRFRAAISYLAHLPTDLWRLRRITTAHNLRAINSQYPGLDSFNFVLMRHLGLFCGKNVFTFQGTDVRLVLGTKGLIRTLWKWMLRRVDVLVFVSEGLKDEFLAFDPRLAERCVVVHNGVDVEAFSRLSSECAPYPTLFDDSHDVVLSIGKFEYRKGHDLLVKAFELVLRQYPSARLAIIGGSGPTLEATRDLIATLGLRDTVTVLTDIPYKQIPSLIRRSEVFVLCSRWEKGHFGEGFPLALAESGALARPVVSTQSTGCDEIIQDRHTGRLVALEDPAALAGAILDVLRDRADANRMASHLHQLVCSQFTWQHVWCKYRRLLEA